MSLRWFRSPAVRPYAALFVWLMTGANLAWCTLDLRQRYDAVVQAQTFRMQCQASGGSYGALGDESTGCFRRANEAEVAETR